MRSSLLALTVMVYLVVAVSAYVLDDEDVIDEYNGQAGHYPMDKRACVPRAGSCDNRPNACCDKSACRCNLWGTNCRCQRAGLLQNWGK